MLAEEILIVLKNSNKHFDIHKYGINHQLGAVISQENKPIAFYSQKLTGTQTRYTVTEKNYLAL